MIKKSRKTNVHLDYKKRRLSIQMGRDRKQQLQSLMQNLFKLQEDERKQFSRELHDELGQWLTAIYAEAEAISNSINKDSSIQASIRAIKENISKMHQVIHGLMHELRPAMLDALGLTDSLFDMRTKWSSRNPDILCKFELEGDFDNFGETINITIYRIIQEALNNICSHAKATRVLVHLEHKLNETIGTNILLLNIEDNGKGFDPEQQVTGFGVLGMRERTIAVGGKFSIFSALGHGTQINIKIPFNRTTAS